MTSDYRNEQQFQTIVCNGKTVSGIQKWANLLNLFLQETSQLTEAYILDYFVEDQWNKLPCSWQEVLEKFDSTDLKCFIDAKETLSYKKPWPLSLLAFRRCTFAFSIPRDSVKSTVPIETFLQETFITKENGAEGIRLERSEWSSENEFSNESGHHKNIPEFCRRHVKRKKQHEIFRLAQVTDIVLKHFGLRHVVDIGSGQGHLSRLLAFCHKLNVATVEAEESHVTGATSFDKQAYSALTKQKAAANTSDIKTETRDKDQLFPHHLEGSMTLATAKECLERISRKAWSNDANEHCEPKFGLLGLHTCGDLAATILRTFAECSQPHALLSVSCCYMKLNSKMDEEGYPLSFYIKSLPNSSLSYEARELACHALEMYIERLKENAPLLKIHCYRAVLEKCIVHHYPEMRHLGLRGVKHAESLPFHEYAEKALSKAQLCIPTDFILSADIQSCLKQWEKVLTFFSLRLLTAPIVESLLLLDRMLYLYENGCPSCLVPIFDPAISPRNCVIISAKPSKM